MPPPPVPPPRLTLVTLGVADVARARAFYDRLGFQASPDSKETVVFYDAGGTVLALWSRVALAEDAGMADPVPGFSGVSLAWNVAAEAEVETVMAHALACGATITRPGQKVFWGGTTGYFADPDGHVWEVAYNPFWPLGANGLIELPKAAT